jgi:hypothetical protein
VQANTGLVGGAGSGVFVAGTALAVAFNDSVPTDDRLLVAEVPQRPAARHGAASAALSTPSSTPQQQPQRDSKQLERRAAVSPCGPAALWNPASVCNLAKLGQNDSVTLTARSGDTLCTVMLSNAG